MSPMRNKAECESYLHTKEFELGKMKHINYHTARNSKDWICQTRRACMSNKITDGNKDICPTPPNCDRYLCTICTWFGNACTSNIEAHTRSDAECARVWKHFHYATPENHAIFPVLAFFLVGLWWSVPRVPILSGSCPVPVAFSSFPLRLS